MKPDRYVEMQAFYSARSRCNNSHSPSFAYYGGRGIEFRFKDFDEFFGEIGVRPSVEHSLDRIDNDGHYEKGNVRWATKTEQMNNRRAPDRSRDRTYHPRNGAVRRSVAICMDEALYQIILAAAQTENRTFSNMCGRLLKRSPQIAEVLAHETKAEAKGA